MAARVRHLSYLPKLRPSRRMAWLTNRRFSFGVPPLGGPSETYRKKKGCARRSRRKRGTPNKPVRRSVADAPCLGSELSRRMCRDAPRSIDLAQEGKRRLGAEIGRDRGGMKSAAG